MKRHCLIPLLLVLPFFVSCSEKETHIDVQPSQLHGLWVRIGTQDYWKYYANGTGANWDESEGKTEETTNMTYTWVLDQDELTHWFRGEQGNQNVPKRYTITSITSNSMKWKDAFGGTYNYSKVTQQ